MKVNQENWNYAFYKSSKLKAFISLVGEEKEGETQLLYTVTVTDPDDNEKFQVDFSELDSALLKLNDQYGHWSFINLEKGEDKDSGDGCGSCAAH
ncbi:MAG: hypothetical protein KC493_16245 [Bacteriovoracaceae bacterium]|nr:hypothetical protein [Bacteriovoracaceae bacterium]